MFVEKLKVKSKNSKNTKKKSKTQSSFDF